jgi:hypothetical protein
MMTSFCDRKYLPVLAGIVLFLVHFFAAYPGAISPDTMDQFTQSLRFNFASHHPPVMAMFWSLLNYIYAGPQTMLFLHISMIWGSVIILYFADEKNKFRWLYFVIPFLPNILSQSANIWKDIGFGVSFLFVISICIYYSYRQNKSSIFMFIISLVITFYGVSVKFQAQFILPIIIAFMIFTILKRGYLFSILGSLFLSFVLITANLTIIDKFTVDTKSWQLRQFFDMAAIVQEIDDDSDLPQYVKDYAGYNFETLKKNFTHQLVNELIFPEYKVLEMTQDDTKLEQLNKSFIKLVQDHPILYLKHRFINSKFMMRQTVPMSAFAEGMDVQEIRSANIHTFENNYLRNFVIKVTGYFPKILTYNFISAFLLCLYAFYCFKNFDSKNNDINIMVFITIVSGAFMITLFFTTMASDYRYYYFIRLLSLFSIPIFLNFLTRPKDNI